MPPHDPPPPSNPAQSDAGSHDNSSDAFLLAQAMGGNPGALGQLLAIYRPRLKLLVEIRIDSRLRQRLDDSDVIQELYLRIHRQAAAPADVQATSAYVWLRRLALWTLGDLQRKHLGVQQRDARRELFLGHAESEGTAVLARLLVDSMALPLEQLLQAEQLSQLQRALEQIGPLDREILVLRHGEQLSRAEAAEVLGITISAAAKRYLRALEKIRELLKNWDSSCAS